MNNPESTSSANFEVGQETLRQIFDNLNNAIKRPSWRHLVIKSNMSDGSRLHTTTLRDSDAHEVTRDRLVTSVAIRTKEISQSDRLNGLIEVALNIGDPFDSKQLSRIYSLLKEPTLRDTPAYKYSLGIRVAEFEVTDIRAYDVNESPPEQTTSHALSYEFDISDLEMFDRLFVVLTN